MPDHVGVPREAIAEFCRRHQIARLSLFGSGLRPDFSSQSDVDLLVEFEPGAQVGLLSLSAMEIELTEMLGRKADLRTPAELSRYFRDRVLAEAEVLYVH